MKRKEMLELYSDFLAVTCCSATATGLSAAVDGAVSHDSVTRFLLNNEFTSKDLWKLTKKHIK